MFGHIVSNAACISKETPNTFAAWVYMFLNIIYRFGDGSFGAKSSLEAMLFFVY